MSISNESPQNFEKPNSKSTWKRNTVFLFSSEPLVSSLGKLGTRPWKTASQTHLGTSELSTSRRPEKNQVILQPSPTLSKGSTHDHSTPRLQFPSLDQHDDVPHLRPSCPNRNRFLQPDSGHPASNSSSSCLTSESISGLKKARDKYLLKATRRARSSARTRSAMSVALQMQELKNASSEVTILTNSAKKCLSMHWQIGSSWQSPSNAVRTISCSLATPPMSIMRRAMRNCNSGQG